MRTWIGPLSLLTLLACGAVDGPSGEASEQGDTAGAATDPEYVVFASHDEAVAWFTDLSTTLPSVGQTFGMIGPIAADDDPRVARIQSLLVTHWNAVVPKFGPRIPIPRVLLTESTTQNAAILFDPRIGKTADVMLVASGILALGDVELSAILSHELGHLVLKNIDPAHNMPRYYAVTGAEPLGISQADDTNVRGVIEPWLKATGAIGPFALAELNGWPTGNSPFATFFGQHYVPHASETSGPCVDFKASVQEVIAALTPLGNDGVELVGTPDQRARLDAATRAVVARSVACMRPAPGVSLYQELASTFHVPVETFTTSPDAAEDAIVRDAPDYVTAMFQLIAAKRTAMRALETTHDFRTFRIYSNEEQADDFSMTLLHAEGTDAAQMGRSILALSPAAVQTQCSAVLAANDVPDYGGLLDAHHGACFRAYHANVFATYLANGGAGVPAAVVPRGAPSPFARTFDPMRDRIVND